MKLRIRYNVGRWFMREYRGKMRYPFMLFSQAKEDVPDWLFRHELEHVYQVRRDGWWKFHIVYLWQLMRRGYEGISYEIEAWKIEDTPLTEEERELKDDS